jgi:hypothetical protein
MRNRFVWLLIFLCYPSAARSQTFLAGQQTQMDKLRAMNQEEVGKLLSSDPPAFCTVAPAVSATMLDANLWNWANMPLEKRIQFEQVYAETLRKLQVCLYDSIQKNDDQTTQSSVFALALMEARYLDLRASLLGDSVARIEQLSGAVDQMQNLMVAMNGSQKRQTQNRFVEILGAALRGFGNWAQYQQQLRLYRTYSVTTTMSQPRPALDVMGMMRSMQNDLDKASHPLGNPPVNCTSQPVIGGSVQTVCH